MNVSNAETWEKKQLTARKFKKDLFNWGKLTTDIFFPMKPLNLVKRYKTKYKTGTFMGKLFWRRFYGIPYKWKHFPGSVLSIRILPKINEALTHCSQSAHNSVETFRKNDVEFIL